MKVGFILVSFIASILLLCFEGQGIKAKRNRLPSRLSRPKVPRHFYPLTTGRSSLRVSGGWDSVGLNNLGSSGGGGGGGLIPSNFIDEFHGKNGGEEIITSDMSLSLMLFQLSSWYTNALVTHPLITRMSTSFLLGAFGDWICQRLESKTSVFHCNYRRLCVFSLVNGLFLATVIHKWFQFLAGMPILKGLNVYQQALLMVSIDQTVGAVFTTIGLICAFEFINRCLPGTEKKFSTFPSDAWTACKHRLPVILVANWYIWPFIQFFNFVFVPEIYRVLVVSTCQMVWNIFLSKILNTENIDTRSDSSVTEPMMQPPELYDVLEGMAADLEQSQDT